MRSDFTDNLNVDRYIFDSQTKANQQGGTGKTFDWSLIPENLKYKIILAGGISPNNVEQAIQQNCLGLILILGWKVLWAKRSRKSVVSF